jgi:hypothetical protein
VPPDSRLYEAARRALGQARKGLWARERGAADEALRAGRWSDALAALRRLQADLGDAREATRQLELKARDLEASPPGGPCVPAGLARLRDPAAASRAVGRPQLVWTGQEYLVVWSDARAASGESNTQQVYLQRLDASGKRLAGEDQPLSAPAADATRPAIDFLDRQCGVVWDELAGGTRRVVFRPLDFLGNPSAEPAIVATGLPAAAFATVAAARSESRIVWAVAWAGREVVDEARGTGRDAAWIAFLDAEGRTVDGPRVLRRPPEPADGEGKPRATATRMPHVAGLGDGGFAAVWEEEGEGEAVVALARFGPAGGDPLWVRTVLPEGAAPRSVQGRLPFVTAPADSRRIAVLWVDRRPEPSELWLSLFDPGGGAEGTSLVARGGLRYHSAVAIDGNLVVARWVRGRPSRLALRLCPAGSGCVPATVAGDAPPGLPLAGLGGRPGLAPGAAHGEFGAVWRERPGVTAGDEGEAEDVASVGDEIFFVRFRCE